MKPSRIPVSAIVVCLIHLSTLGAVKYAQPGGGGDCSSWANACGLQAAIDAASAGDSVWAKAGTYAGEITLKSGIKVIGGFAGTELLASQSDSKANPTIINGNGSTRCVSGGGEGPDTLLRGFILKNGSVTGMDDWGGGLFLEESSLVVVDCVFEQNQAGFFGAGASVVGGAVEFVNCIFKDNGLLNGAGSLPHGGGGVHLKGGQPKVTNCLFYKNYAGDGGAVFSDGSRPTLINCTLARNEAGRGGGAIFDMRGEALLRNSILWDNAAADFAEILNGRKWYTSTWYSDVVGGRVGLGNVDGDPLFFKPNVGSFWLKQYSPCIDEGSNSVLPADVGDLDWDGNKTETIPRDLAGNPRKINFTVDMGAYEAPLYAEE